MMMRPRTPPFATTYLTHAGRKPSGATATWSLVESRRPGTEPADQAAQAREDDVAEVA
jgi:hypothetical protein